MEKIEGKDVQGRKMKRGIRRKKVTEKGEGCVGMEGKKKWEYNLI